MIAASQGHLEIVKELLAMSNGANVNAANRNVSEPNIPGIILRISWYICAEARQIGGNNMQPSIQAVAGPAQPPKQLLPLREYHSRMYMCNMQCI